jgi:hypothetical protein
VGAHDRARLEQLCRYLLRPPLADDRLRLLGDGRVRVELKRAWSDGTTHLLFEPVELLEKLAALMQRVAVREVSLEAEAQRAQIAVVPSSEYNAREELVSIRARGSRATSRRESRSRPS